MHYLKQTVIHFVKLEERRVELTSTYTLVRPPHPGIHTEVEGREDTLSHISFRQTKDQDPESGLDNVLILFVFIFDVFMLNYVVNNVIAQEYIPKNEKLD